MGDFSVDELGALPQIALPTLNSDAPISMHTKAFDQIDGSTTLCSINASICSGSVHSFKIQQEGIHYDAGETNVDITHVWSDNDEILEDLSIDLEVNKNLDTPVNLSKDSGLNTGLYLISEFEYEFEREILQQGLQADAGGLEDNHDSFTVVNESPSGTGSIELRMQEAHTVDGESTGDITMNEITLCAGPLNANDPEEKIIEIRSPKPLDQVVAEFNFSTIQELEHVEITVEMEGEGAGDQPHGEIIWIDNVGGGQCTRFDMSKMNKQEPVRRTLLCRRHSQEIHGVFQQPIPTLNNEDTSDSESDISFTGTEDIDTSDDTDSSCAKNSDGTVILNPAWKGDTALKTRCSQLEIDRFSSGGSADARTTCDILWSNLNYANHSTESTVRAEGNKGTSTCQIPYEFKTAPRYNGYVPSANQYPLNALGRVKVATDDPDEWDCGENVCPYCPLGAAAHSPFFPESSKEETEKSKPSTSPLDDWKCFQNEASCQYCKILRENNITPADMPKSGSEDQQITIDEAFVKQRIENEDICPYCEILWLNGLCNENSTSDNNDQSEEDMSEVSSSSCSSSGLSCSHSELLSGSGNLIHEGSPFSSSGEESLIPWAKIAEEFYDKSCYLEKKTSDQNNLSTVRTNNPEKPSQLLLVNDVNYEYEYEELAKDVDLHETYRDGQSLLNVFNGKFAGVYEKVPNLRGIDDAIMIVQDGINEPVYYVDENLASFQLPVNKDGHPRQRLYLLEMHAGQGEQFEYGVVMTDGTGHAIDSSNIIARRASSEQEIHCINPQPSEQSIGVQTDIVSETTISGICGYDANLPRPTRGIDDLIHALKIWNSSDKSEL